MARAQGCMLSVRTYLQLMSPEPTSVLQSVLTCCTRSMTAKNGVMSSLGGWYSAWISSSVSWYCPRKLETCSKSRCSSRLAPASVAAWAWTCWVSRLVLSRNVCSCVHLASSASTCVRTPASWASVCESPSRTDCASAICVSSSDERRFVRSAASEDELSEDTEAGATTSGVSLATSVCSSALVASISERECSSLCTRACSVCGAAMLIKVQIPSVVGYAVGLRRTPFRWILFDIMNKDAEVLEATADGSFEVPRATQKRTDDAAGGFDG